jgi:hypothetical protein
LKKRTILKLSLFVSVLSCTLGIYSLVNVSNEVSTNASDNNKKTTYTDSKENSTEEKSNPVTSEKHNSKLNEYIKNNPEKFDKSNPTGIIDSYMEENHIDTISTSNY